MKRSAPLLRGGGLHPGSMEQRGWVPALRCIVKNAAPRPGHEISPPNLLRIRIGEIVVRPSVFAGAAGSNPRPGYNPAPRCGVDTLNTLVMRGFVHEVVRARA